MERLLRDLVALVQNSQIETLGIDLQDLDYSYLILRPKKIKRGTLHCYFSGLSN